MKRERLTEYVTAIEAQKKKFSDLEIYTGLEVDYIPSAAKPDDFKNVLDYTIGSVHFVDTFADGRHWEIDGTHASFLEGLEKIFQNDIKHVVQRYFELTREMIQKSTPTIVGHLDKIKIQNTGRKFYSESDNWYQKEIITTLDVIKQSAAIIEVNTRGLYQKKTENTYPSEWILQEILKRNIPATISSDAHHTKDLINYFPQTALELLAIGFRKISILSEGLWQPATLTADGITFSKHNDH